MEQAFEIFYLTIFAFYGGSRISKLAIKLYDNDKPEFVLIPGIGFLWVMVEIILSSLAANCTVFLFNYIRR